MVDTTCTMSMHRQDWSLLTNIVNWKTNSTICNYFFCIIFFFFIAIKKLICGSNKYAVRRLNDARCGCQLRLGDSDSAAVYGKWCGSMHIPPIILQNNVLRLTFVSAETSDDSGQGFLAVFSRVANSLPADGSGNRPGQYLFIYLFIYFFFFFFFIYFFI